MIRPPLNIIVLLPQRTITIHSLDEPTFVDISECKYADLLTLVEIVEAQEYSKTIKLIYNSTHLNTIRERHQDDSIGLLVLRLFEHQLLFVVDDERDIQIEEVVTTTRRQKK